MDDGDEHEKSGARTLPSFALIRGLRKLGLIYQSHPGRFFVLSAIAVTIAVPMVAATLSYNGYCFAQHRFLSRTEYIDSALHAELTRDASRVAKTHQASVLPTLSDAQSIRDAKPDCCILEKHEVRDHGPLISFSHKLFGKAAAIVQIAIPSKSHPNDSTIFTQYAVENCGRSWNTVH